jgi:hypothetical protein
MSDKNPKSLSPDEEKQLQELIEAIRNQQASWLIKGKALFTIDAGKLWRGCSSSLSDFAAKFLDMLPAETSQYFNGYKIHTLLVESGFKDLPANEGQVRELLRLKEGKEPDREKVVKAWTRVLEQHGPERITATRIRETLDALFGEKRTRTPQPEPSDRPDLAEMPELTGLVQEPTIKVPPPPAAPKAEPRKTALPKEAVEPKKAKRETLTISVPPFVEGKKLTASVRFDGSENIAESLRKCLAPDEVNEEEDFYDFIKSSDDARELLTALRTWIGKNADTVKYPIIVVIDEN